MKKELEIQYRLSSHPNIAKLFAYFYDRDHIYSVLEYVPEGNLYQILRKVGCFNESTTRKIIQQVVSALFFCQQRNIIHRDIKPENILVMSSKTWYVKLCDFGWSTHSINQNRMTFCGTPDYLAPELV
jgi:serine/threonine protein kinase